MVDVTPPMPAVSLRRRGGSRWGQAAAAPPPRGARRHATRCEQGLDRIVRWTGARPEERERRWRWWEGAHFCQSSFFFSLLFFNSALLLVGGLQLDRFTDGSEAVWAHPDRSVADRLRLVPAIADAAAVLLPCWTGMCDAIWHATSSIVLWSVGWCNA
jgi:hypothetical protein